MFPNDPLKWQQAQNQNGSNSYQIRKGDTFESIAAQNGFSVEDIQNANNGMLVPPPKGSYITMPYLQPGYQEFGSGYSPGRNEQGGYYSEDPITFGFVENPGRNVQGGGDMSLYQTTPGRNVMGGVGMPIFGPGRNVQGGGDMSLYHPPTPGRNVIGGIGMPNFGPGRGRNVQGGGDMSQLYRPGPGRNVQGGWRPTQGPQRPVGNNVPSGYGSSAYYQNLRPNQQAAPFYTQAQVSAGINAATQQNDIALQQVHTSLQSGVLPQSISMNTFNNLVNQATGMKYTQKDMEDNGYTFNPVTGSYNLGTPHGTPNGVPAATQGGYSNTAAAQQYAANQTPLEQQKRWDPKSKKFVKIGDLIRQGRLDPKTGKMYNQPMKRNRNGRLVSANQEEPQAAPQEAPLTYGSTSGPGHILNNNQGGG